VYDPAERRKATRAGRQRGCSIYIPADDLRAAGINPDEPTPHYRIWPSARGSLLIRLYKEK
jgi:hypothetical protein